MAVNYGRHVQRYLLEQVTLLHIHQFEKENVQFEDALVSSAIVWFRKESPPPNHVVRFTKGGTLLEPEQTAYLTHESLCSQSKWSPFSSHAFATKKDRGVPLGDLFDLKRGFATGANKFFLMTEEEAQERRIPEQFLKPVLPSPRYLSDTVIETGETGQPLLDRQIYLLSCSWPESQVQAEYPDLWQYLQTGIEQGIHERYLCRKRNPWYAQESRKPAPFYCSYMGRGKNGEPFRFFMNHSEAIVTNVYLNLYPTPRLQEALRLKPNLLATLWDSLNQIENKALVRNGRTYGGGLHKLEPRELAATFLYGLPTHLLNQLKPQSELFAET